MDQRSFRAAQKEVAEAYKMCSRNCSATCEQWETEHLIRATTPADRNNSWKMPSHCNNCGKQLIHKSWLEVHREPIHGVPVKNVVATSLKQRTWENTRIWTQRCDKCGNQSSLSEGLRRHKGSEHQRKCDYCNKEFSQTKDWGNARNQDTKKLCSLWLQVHDQKGSRRHMGSRHEAQCA